MKRVNLTAHYYDVGVVVHEHPDHRKIIRYTNREFMLQHRISSLAAQLQPEIVSWQSPSIRQDPRTPGKRPMIYQQYSPVIIPEGIAADGLTRTLRLSRRYYIDKQARLPNGTQNIRGLLEAQIEVAPFYEEPAGDDVWQELISQTPRFSTIRYATFRANLHLAESTIHLSKQEIGFKAGHNHITRHDYSEQRRATVWLEHARRAITENGP